MIIANPIYDVVFKRLMENERIAKFLIGTLLNQKVKTIQVRPQEFTYENELAGLRIFRLDFIAIIETDTGEERKILIEIQKAYEEIDLMRFRNYLAEQYKKKDNLNGEELILPITTIYILGFKLPEIDSACFHVERQYKDLIDNKLLDKKSRFIESLTHDSYIVQVKKIGQRYQSKLDKLLSIFEQRNFIGDDEILKDYNYEVDLAEVKLMADLLYKTGADAETRKQIAVEEEAWRSVNALMASKNKAIQEKDKALEEKDKTIEQKDKIIDEKDKLIEELKRRLDENK